MFVHVPRLYAFLVKAEPHGLGIYHMECPHASRAPTWKIFYVVVTAAWFTADIFFWGGGKSPGFPLHFHVEWLDCL